MIALTPWDDIEMSEGHIRTSTLQGAVYTLPCHALLEACLQLRECLLPVWHRQYLDEPREKAIDLLEIHVLEHCSQPSSTSVSDG